MKDRSKMTREELVADCEYFEQVVTDQNERLKTNFDKGRYAEQEHMRKLIEPLYRACFKPTGWIGWYNLNTNKVGQPLLELLANFHKIFKG